MPKPPVDYSVYLVTDSTPAVLGPGRTVAGVVGAAFADSPKGSIGIVQLREKASDARTMLATLAELHACTASAGAPLLVNDRVDVAAAAMARGHCEGVHLGQEDIDVGTARRLLGDDAIIGVTASTVDEAVRACRDGADYLGLGTVFATPTKTDTKHVVGTAGIQRMLRAMAAAGYGHIPAVCIGGVNASNARHVVFQCGYQPLPEEEVEGEQQQQPTMTTAAVGKKLDGVAVVSAIMAAADPGAAAATLADEVRLGKTAGPTGFYTSTSSIHGSAVARSSPMPGSPSTATVQRILRAVSDTTPLSHNMTNQVVQNIAANIALAVGASPIMSNNGSEAADLARVPASALVVNMGTVTADTLANYVQAIRAYNAAGRPVIFDPVGAGATAVRREAVKTILNAGYIDVIKGNEGEIQAVYLSGLDEDERKQAEAEAGIGQQRGVDGGNALDATARSRLVRRLAAREKCVVVLTGEVDYVSDATGERMATVAEGHPILGQVTGMGCSLGTVLSATVAVAATAAGLAPDAQTAEQVGDVFSAVIAGMLLFERAAARAATQRIVGGPGSFVPVFLDELARCQRLTANGDMSWASS